MATLTQLCNQIVVVKVQMQAARDEQHNYQNVVVVGGGSSRFSRVNGHGSRRE